MRVSRMLVLVVIGCLFCVSYGSTLPRIDPSFFEAFPQANPKDLAFSLRDLQHRGPYVDPAPVLRACPVLPTPAPTKNVNSLKPGHIKVIMAMGDSITAAMSAKDTTLLNLNEYRGICYAIGGDANVLTMANMLKQQAPNLIGQATGIGKRTAAGTGFDAAVSGALSIDMPGQAEWLVARLKDNKSVNMTEDWKVLTLWIGSNNLCAVCKNNEANNADNFEKYVTQALEYIYNNVPRVFVNLIANLDVSKLNGYTAGTCGSLHIYECPCTTNDANSKIVAQNARDFQTRAYKIAENFNSRKNEEFAVVVQPFLTESQIFNRTYLSAADCFHPSALCHQAISIALWNSMITPAAQKQKAFIQDEPAVCATADSFLYTN